MTLWNVYSVSQTVSEDHIMSLKLYNSTRLSIVIPRRQVEVTSLAHNQIHGKRKSQDPNSDLTQEPTGFNHCAYSAYNVPICLFQKSTPD